MVPAASGSTRTSPVGSVDSDIVAPSEDSPVGGPNSLQDVLWHNSEDVLRGRSTFTSAPEDDGLAERLP